MDSHLFDHLGPPRKEPLASRLRPQTIDDIIGQTHILGKGRLLRRAILSDQISSLIFYGPPGTGKTTLAQVIANHTQGHFMSINAVLSGIATIRKSIEEAQHTYRLSQKKSILFVDEVHRFNKNQQDALLPHVENGTIILIGATTENPYFEVNKALVSRSRIFELKPLTTEDLHEIVDHALASPKGYGHLKVSIDPDAKSHLIQTSNGDARTLLNAIELAVEPELIEGKNQPSGSEQTQQEILIDIDIAEESIQKRAVLYDRDGDAHYDTISAFIKSMRGSDSDAALYWLAKMVHAGEDPKFIFRRMIISASEDVGLASPQVLTHVMAASQAFDYVGMPEGQFHLTQACLCICNAPKSNSTMGFFEALRAVKKAHAEKDDIPNHLKDGSRDGDDLGHGKGYKYPHAFENHWVAQHYLPEGMQGKIFYHPSQQGEEKQIQKDTQKRREACWAAFTEKDHQSAYGLREDSSSEWEQRSIDNQEKQMLMLRDLAFDLAQPQREDLVLDVHPQSGFFSLEASRIAISGGVHSLCRQKKEFEALQQLTAHLPSFEQPFLYSLKDDNQTYSDGAEQHEGLNDLRFNLILLRQSHDRWDEPHRQLTELSQRLTEQGRIVSCDYLIQDEQRLWQTLERLHFKSSELETLKELEEAFFASKHFESHFNKNSFEPLVDHLRLRHQSVHSITFKKKFLKPQVLAWFSHSSPLGQFLESQIHPETVKKIGQTVAQSLHQRSLPWERQLCVSCLEKPTST